MHYINNVAQSGDVGVIISVEITLILKLLHQTVIQTPEELGD